MALHHEMNSHPLGGLASSHILERKIMKSESDGHWGKKENHQLATALISIDFFSDWIVEIFFAQSC